MVNSPQGLGIEEGVVEVGFGQSQLEVSHSVRQSVQAQQTYSLVDFLHELKMVEWLKGVSKIPSLKGPLYLNHYLVL